MTQNVYTHEYTMMIKNYWKKYYYLSDDICDMCVNKFYNFISKWIKESRTGTHLTYDRVADLIIYAIRARARDDCQMLNRKLLESEVKKFLKDKNKTNEEIKKYFTLFNGLLESWLDEEGSHLSAKQVAEEMIWQEEEFKKMEG